MVTAKISKKESQYTIIPCYYDLFPEVKREEIYNNLTSIKYQHKPNKFQYKAFINFIQLILSKHINCSQ